MNEPKIISSQLNQSNLCILFGLNSRYESSSFNVKLRKRYLKGNFKIVSFGSFNELTIPVTTTGLTIKDLQQFVEGNSFLCQELNRDMQTLLVASSTIFARDDSDGVLKLFE